MANGPQLALLTPIVAALESPAQGTARLIYFAVSWRILKCLGSA